MIWCFLVVLAILEIVGRWLFFKKNEEESWKSLIPFYSDYIVYKIIEKPVYFYVSCPVFCLMVLLLLSTDTSILNMVCLFVCESIVFLTLIFRSYYLAKGLKQSPVIGIVLFFLEPIVLPVLCSKKEDEKIEEKK